MEKVPFFAVTTCELTYGPIIRRWPIPSDTIFGESLKWIVAPATGAPISSATVPEIGTVSVVWASATTANSVSVRKGRRRQHAVLLFQG